MTVRCVECGANSRGETLYRPFGPIDTSKLESLGIDIGAKTAIQWRTIATTFGLRIVRPN